MKILLLLIALAGVVTNDVMVSVTLATLLAGYALLNVGTVPVLFAAFAFQWTQVSCGFLYTTITGRPLAATYATDYRTMMYLGLITLLTLAVGTRLGYVFLAQRTTEQVIRRPIVSPTILWVLYGGSIAATAALQQLAWQYPALKEPIYALTFARLGVLYLVMRRLAAPDFQPIKLGLIIAFEVVLGMTEYFAGFREPIVLGLLAIFEVFDRRKAVHWVSACALLVVASYMGLMWLGIRTEYRRDFVDVEMFAESRDMRLARLQELTLGWWKRDSQELWWTLDQLIERLWAVQYPALAVQRVPSTVPHTNGELLGAALAHILAPRVLFPDKPALPSDSELVREYSGVNVAGAEKGTSIGFGYAAESYVDFGVPLMFLPVLVWGLFVGIAFRAVQVLIHHREISIPVLTVIFWLSLYLFERSWAKMIGGTGTLLIYVGGGAVILDRLIEMFATRRGVDVWATPDTPPQDAHARGTS